MRYLIDTHILIWHGENNPALKSETALLLNDPSNEILVSFASIWEIAIKASIGKLELGFPIGRLEQILSQHGFTIIPFEFRHFEAVSNLPFFHNDPFDRMIIAQAQTENIEIITHDNRFKHYSVKVVWN